MSIYNRVKEALEKNPAITRRKSELSTTEGFSEEYLDSIGLDKRDLKWLERKGLAMRGYSKNIWSEGDVLSNGTNVLAGQQYTGRGHRVRWVLVSEEGTNENKNVSEMSEGTPPNKVLST